MGASGRSLLVGTALSKRYSGSPALKAASVDVARGSITAVIGPNGAGKSTLFDVLAGFLKADGGTVSFNDQDVTSLPAFLRARRGLVKTFQIPHEFHSMTVLENLLVAASGQTGERFPAVLWRFRRIRHEEEELRAQAEKILASLDLSRVRDHPAGLLSGGQKKLLELARALMLEPTCLLLDEPLAGVRPTLVENILDHLGAVRDRGITILVVEHNLEAIMRLADYVYVLVDGEVLFGGDPGTVQSDERVLAAYLGGAI